MKHPLHTRFIRSALILKDINVPKLKDNVCISVRIEFSDTWFVEKCTGHREWTKHDLSTHSFPKYPCVYIIMRTINEDTCMNEAIRGDDLMENEGIRDLISSLLCPFVDFEMKPTYNILRCGESSLIYLDMRLQEKDGDTESHVKFEFNPISRCWTIPEERASVANPQKFLCCIASLPYLHGGDMSSICVKFDHRVDFFKWIPIKMRLSDLISQRVVDEFSHIDDYGSLIPSEDGDDVAGAGGC